jgi:cell division protein ZapA
LEQPVKVRILDHEYLVRSDEGEKQIQRVAEFVNERFKEIKDGTQGLSETKTAILAAFHIASEYFQALKDRDDLSEEVQDRARALNLRIDSITR